MTMSICICRLGKFGTIGRYPFHLHNLADTGANSFATNVSVHSSFQRCYVVHCTDGATLRDNTCFDVVGFGFMLVSHGVTCGASLLVSLLPTHSTLPPHHH